MSVEINKNIVVEKVKAVAKFIVKYKYYVATVIFAVWIVFFDATGLLYKKSLKQDVKNLRTELEYYKQKTIDNREKLELLKSDPESVEKFAREKYYLKKDNEDVFIIVDNTEN